MRSAADQSALCAWSFRDRVLALADEHEALLMKVDEMRQGACSTTYAVDTSVKAAQGVWLDEFTGRTTANKLKEQSVSNSGRTVVEEHHEVNIPQETEQGRQMQKISSTNTFLTDHTSGTLFSQISLFSLMEAIARIRAKVNFYRNRPESHTRCASRVLFVQIERSRMFEFTCTLIIVLNTLTLGLSTELLARQVVTEVPLVLHYTELAFTVCYVCELVIRLFAHGLRFFFGHDWGWHWMDFALVVTTVYEQLVYFMSPANHGDGNSTFASLRLVRLCKAVKLLRVVRVLRSFGELRTILDSIVGSMRAMLWILVLVFLVTFMFALCFMQSVDHTGDPSETHWRSIPVSMLHLLSFSLGGEDWIDMYWALYDRSGSVYNMLFFTYLMFFHFILQNTVTSVFVESMLVDKANNQFLIMEERMRNKEKYMKIIETMWHDMERMSSEGVTRAQLLSHMKSEDMRMFASVLDIQDFDLELFCNILTSYGQRSVDLEHFVMGCIKLRGTARSIDLFDVARDLKKLGGILDVHRREVGIHFDDHRQQLEIIRQHSVMSVKHDALDSPRGARSFHL